MQAIGTKIIAVIYVDGIFVSIDQFAKIETNKLMPIS